MKVKRPSWAPAALRDPVLLQTLFALTLVLQEQMDTFQAWGLP